MKFTFNRHSTIAIAINNTHSYSKIETLIAKKNFSKLNVIRKAIEKCLYVLDNCDVSNMTELRQLKETSLELSIKLHKVNEGLALLKSHRDKMIAEFKGYKFRPIETA